MTTEKVADLQIVKLTDYFDSNKFRLIPTDAVGTTGGISEVPVIFNLHANFSKKLNFDTRNLQKLYGFSIIDLKLKEINNGPYYSIQEKGFLAYIELNDCGSLWIFKLSFFDEKDKLLAVKSSEVVDLLNNCRKPALIDREIL